MFVFLIHTYTHTHSDLQKRNFITPLNQSQTIQPEKENSDEEEEFFSLDTFTSKENKRLLEEIQQQGIDQYATFDTLHHECNDDDMDIVTVNVAADAQKHPHSVLHSSYQESILGSSLSQSSNSITTLLLPGISTSSSSLLTKTHKERANDDNNNNNDEVYFVNSNKLIIDSL
jgi:hypothetical protein